MPGTDSYTGEQTYEGAEVNTNETQTPSHETFSECQTAARCLDVVHNDERYRTCVGK